MKGLLITIPALGLLTGCAPAAAPLVNVGPIADGLTFLGGSVVIAAIILTFGGFILRVLGLWR